MKRYEYKTLIDISALPRIQYRKDHDQVDWSRAMNMILPFSCGDTHGHIIFLDKKDNRVLVRRIIDGSNNFKDVWILKSAILTKNLSRSMFNEIAFTCPDLLNYFVNKEDAYRFTKTSRESSMFKCPVCGHIKPYNMASISSLGFKCDRCSDKSFQYPNKFMMNILDQINCTYQTEVTKTTKGFEWLENYRYDFLIFYENKKYFIEMDGYFHYNDNQMNGRTKEEQQKIDAYKDSLAHKHNCNVIRINCCYKNLHNRFDFIKNNIINSEIIKILHIDENDIDWDDCDRKALSNIFHTICDCWNSGTHHTKTIAKELGISWSCVHENLLKGLKLGLCDYDPKEASELNHKNQQLKNGNPITVLKDGIIVGIFISGRELSRQSVNLFGCYFNPGSISYARRGICKTCYGYEIKGITHEEYEQLLPQFKTIQNECNLQEVI